MRTHRLWTVAAVAFLLAACSTPPPPAPPADDETPEVDLVPRPRPGLPSASEAGEGATRTFRTPDGKLEILVPGRWTAKTSPEPQSNELVFEVSSRAGGPEVHVEWVEAGVMFSGSVFSAVSAWNMALDADHTLESATAETGHVEGFLALRQDSRWKPEKPGGEVRLQSLSVGDGWTVYCIAVLTVGASTAEEEEEIRQILESPRLASPTPPAVLEPVMRAIAASKDLAYPNLNACHKAGTEAASAGDLTRAISIYTVGLREWRREPAFLFNRAMQLYLLGAYAEALADLAAWMAAKVPDEPLTPEADRYRGCCCYKLGMKKEAETLLRRAEMRGAKLTAEQKAWMLECRVEPAAEAAKRNERGKSLLQANDLKAALAEFEAATELAPWDAESGGNAGRTLLLLGDHDGALEAFDDAVRLDPRLEPEYREMISRARAKSGG